MARLGLAWVLGRPGVTSTLIGARSPTQVDQAFEALALGSSDDMRAELNSL
jgi:NDP-hexose 2,3-enoyl reductase